MLLRYLVNSIQDDSVAWRWIYEKLSINVYYSAFSWAIDMIAAVQCAQSGLCAQTDEARCM
jgi:hypothetical protein